MTVFATSMRIQNNGRLSLDSELMDTKSTVYPALLLFNFTCYDRHTPLLMIRLSSPVGREVEGA